MRFIPYDPEQKDEIIRLLAGASSSDYERIKRQLWDWQFFQNPHGGETTPFIVSVDEDRVVGFNGSMPTLIKYNDESLDAIWSCDTVLRRSCRGKGHGKALLRAIQAKRRIVLGFGISDAAARVLDRNGWKANDDIEMFARCNRIGNLKDVARRITQFFVKVQNLANRPSVHPASVRIVDAAELPRAIDVLWSRVEPEYEKAVIRDYDYIHWKYGSHPILPYRAIVVEDGREILAVGIFRNGDWQSRLVDYLGPRESLWIKYLIVKSFIKACADSRHLECTSTDPELQSALRCLGFRQYRGQKPRFYVYSNLEEDPVPQKNWFLMGGDSDGDLLPPKRG